MISSEALGWPARKFIEYYWEADELRIEQQSEVKKVERKVVVSLCIATRGGYYCELCHVEPAVGQPQLEGHHVFHGAMYISEYRHCITRKSRQRALERLWRELVFSVVMLCKGCHETTHHQRARSVKQGIGAVSVCCWSVPVYQVSVSFEDLFAGVFPCYHQPPSVVAVAAQFRPRLANGLHKVSLIRILAVIGIHQLLEVSPGLFLPVEVFPVGPEEDVLYALDLLPHLLQVQGRVDGAVVLDEHWVATGLGELG